jgi:hypothetical protein
MFLITDCVAERRRLQLKFTYNERLCVLAVMASRW